MTDRRRSALLVLALTSVFAGPARAEVLRATDDGFAVSRTETIAASTLDTWQLLIRPAQWWSADHSWSGDAANLALDPRAGGCFCESLPGGGSVEHMRVIYADPGKLLRMVGTLGPLQSESLTGVLSIELWPQGAGTKLTWTYKVAGASDIPLEGLAPVVGRVVGEQFHRLAAARP